MKQTNLQLLILAVLCTVLSACGSGTDQASRNETSDKPAAALPKTFQVTLISVEIRRSHDQTSIDMNIDPIQSDVLHLE